MKPARTRVLRAVPAAALLLFVGCAQLSPAAAPTAPLRVMTFNIRYGTAPDGENAWPLRRELVFGVIREFRPDVLGLQEVLRFQLDELRAALPGYEEVGVGRDDGRAAGEYAAILYDGRRLEVLEQGSFWLSDTPERPGSMSWGNRIPRIATWARFRHRDGGATFYAYNTHFDHESQPARERSAALLLQRMAARSQAADPVLLTGDFNSGEANPAFRTLLAPARAGGAGLRDSFRLLHPAAGAVGTYQAFRPDSTGEKIDAILVSPAWVALEAGIVRSMPGGRLPSDHFPVTAVLRLHD